MGQLRVLRYTLQQLRQCQDERKATGRASVSANGDAEPNGGLLSHAARPVNSASGNAEGYTVSQAGTRFGKKRCTALYVSSHSRNIVLHDPLIDSKRA